MMKGRFRKLQWRFFSFLALSMVTLVSLFAFFYQRFLTVQVTREAVAHSALVADTIHLGLAQNMMGDNREGIQRSLKDIRHNPLITEVLIVDPEGRIVFSSHPELVGSNLRHSSFSRMEGEGLWKIAEKEGGGREIYRFSPIPNRQVCRECHSSSRKILGKVALRMSLEHSEKMLRESSYFLVGLVSVLLLLLFVVNARFFAANVTKPIDRLLRRFQEVREGNMKEVELTGDEPPGELADLGERFEDLVREVRRLHEDEKEKEKAFVLLRQEQEYQDELEAVNRALTGKVEELNGANRRIKNLADQLEVKNDSLQAAVKNISALNRVGVALSSEIDLDKLVTLLINISVKGLRAEIGHIMLMDSESGSLVMQGWTGMGDDFDPTRKISPGESVSGMVAKSGKAVLLSSFEDAGGIKAVSRYGYRRRSVVSVPIRIKDRILGVIELTNKRGTASFDEDDLGMLQSIAGQAAVAIENANLYRKIQKSYFDTIKALVQAVEEKDKYTRGHSERVTAFSVRLGRKMNFDEKQIEALSYGGVLHDIGKIGINVNILQKPGKLTEKEFDIIRNHPIIGERIIKPIEFLKDVLPIVSQHHERFDGMGYPHGLEGSQTVPEARVLAVADAYDAMRTPRPYRDPLPQTEAIAELRRCSSTQFDPIVVEHFLAILEDDPEVRKLEESLSLVGT